MGLALRQIRKNTATARALMKRSRAEKFAVGGFNLDSQETIKAVCRAAVVKNSPVIVEVNSAEAESIGLENIRDLVDNYKQELGLEIYAGLYHVDTNLAIAGIEVGFEFIGVDFTKGSSEFSNKEISAKTKLITNYARLTGALVEGELPYFEGSEELNNKKVKENFSNPEDAKKFVKSTGVDIFAVAAGNLHKNFALPKSLDFKLINRMQKEIDCNISLHGGEGIPDHYFKDSIKSGLTKISIGEDTRLAFINSLKKVLNHNADELSTIELMDEVISDVQQVVEDKIDVFGSAGKAKQS